MQGMLDDPSRERIPWLVKSGTTLPMLRLLRSWESRYCLRMAARIDSRTACGAAPSWAT